MHHALNVIRYSTVDEHDSSDGGGAGSAADQKIGSKMPRPNQRSLLIDSICVSADIRHPTDVSLLKKGQELAETLIDAMHVQIRESFGHQPLTLQKQARQQLPAMAKKKRPQILKIRKAIKQQIEHLKRNLASIDALAACGATLLMPKRHA